MSNASAPKKRGGMSPTAIETESTLVGQPKGKKIESAFHPSPTYGVPEGLRGFGGRVANASTFAKAMVDKTADRSDDKC